LALTKRLATPQRRVALVDAHGADPQIARRLGILAQNGWETVLAGRRTLADVMVEAADVHLAVLPLCGAPPTDGFDEGMSDAIGALRQNYDTVVVDLPPVSPKACEALKHVDAVIMVQHEAISAMARLVAVQKHLAEAEVELLGVVQNFAGE
jgi:Mrp family chromosome partitioning ATPase